VDASPLGTTSTCRGCTARIAWCLTIGGRRLPLDPAPSPHGTVVVQRQPDGTIRGRVLTGPELPAQGTAYRPHWQTCPSSEAFRRRQQDTGPRCGACRLPLDEEWSRAGHTRHVGCLPVPRPEVTPVEPPPAPVVHEQATLDLGGAW
jgi:hypothetical protein